MGKDALGVTTDPVPTEGPIAFLTIGYKMFGNLTREEFEKKWYQGTDWKWPNGDNGGFVLKKGEHVSTKVTLQPGTLIDRFGGDTSFNGSNSYFAPLALPFTLRSIPPSMVTDAYNVFRVLRPLEVEVGLVQPGFEQTGYGTQFVAAEGVAKLLDTKQDGGAFLQRLSQDEANALYKIGA